MVLFASLILAPNLFVPIAIIAYLYLSLTYAGYPYLVRLLVPKSTAGWKWISNIPPYQKSEVHLHHLRLPAAVPAVAGRRAADPLILPRDRD